MCGFTVQCNVPYAGRHLTIQMLGCCVPAERDALLKLIGSLRREYEAVQMAKNHQEEELKNLKERMTVGVSRVSFP